MFIQQLSRFQEHVQSLDPLTTTLIIIIIIIKAIAKRFFSVVLAVGVAVEALPVKPAYGRRVREVVLQRGRRARQGQHRQPPRHPPRKVAVVRPLRRHPKTGIGPSGVNSFIQYWT